MRVEFNKLFLANIDSKQEKVLVLYNLSANHYVCLIVSDEPKTGSEYIQALDKFADFSEVIDVSRKEIVSPIYSKGKILSVDTPTRYFITKRIKQAFINGINTKTNHRVPDDLSFLKWTHKKIKLNSNESTIDLARLKAFQICWIDFGFNVGSELRKIRPAILWRGTTDKKMWTIIPLSTKCKEDNYYFHYDITSISDSSVKVESLMNLSANRIIEPYYYNNKIAHLNETDKIEIIKIIERYYLFK